MTWPDAIARTVRLVTASWSRTARTGLLLVFIALAGALFIAIRQHLLITW